MKSVPKLLVKSILIPLGLIAAALGRDAAIHRTCLDLAQQH